MKPIISFEVKPVNGGLTVYTLINGSTVAMDRFDGSIDVAERVKDARVRLLTRAERLYNESVLAQSFLNEVNHD